MGQARIPVTDPNVHVRVRLPIYMGTGKEGLYINFIISLLHGELSADGF